MDGLLGCELVAHILVPVDGPVPAESVIGPVWEQCVEEYGLRESIADHPTELPADLGEAPEEVPLAARRLSGDGVQDLVLRRMHDVLCLSFVCAPNGPADWPVLHTRWGRVRAACPPSVLGTAEILQARHAAKADPDQLGTPPPLRGLRWSAGVRRQPPELGPFAVWEANPDGADRALVRSRTHRTFAVVAPKEADSQLSRWTWRREDGRAPLLARYLIQAAKLRYEARIVEAADRLEPLRRAVTAAAAELRTQLGAGGSPAAALADLRLLDLRLRSSVRTLGALRRTAGIAATNMERLTLSEEPTGPFAEDLAVARWLQDQLAVDLGYLDDTLAEARDVIEVAAATAMPPSPSRLAMLGSSDRRVLVDALERDPVHLARAATGDLRTEADELVRRAEAEGWITRLVTGAYLADPDGPGLRRLVEAGFLDEERAAGETLKAPAGPVRALVPEPDLLDEVPEAGLERILRSAHAFQNPEVFVAALQRRAGQVCRIRVDGPREWAWGSGMLVGPDLVLTNHHVLDLLFTGEARPSGVKLTFGHRVRADGEVEPGTATGLAAEWRVVDSPPGALDFAVVRLAASPGAAPLVGGRPRGWFDLLAERPAPVAGTPLLVLQHPDGHPLKLAIDTEGVHELGPGSLTYGVNTFDGSSGSPCLNLDLDLVALHRGTVPGGTANRGVPITDIAAHIRACGREDDFTASSS
ncbi:CATRA conflict system CASPASE/TPR repeat-associated protein [Pseudonocardia oroxyli]|uniref:Trypsin-like peptidase domain-containing protein n=1 Tax=Pseudonocardia oroxyli TaxID=366584 RepID=A0A1G7XDB7_PSEOR|nr:CATRA conflict system CASPASE/TPR repeat-associated protein [Pseudonocardia oroxyli]SDG82189.1 Trypsin-like peptidase domain-containing protein [Pseudonocardia oroxyli]